MLEIFVIFTKKPKQIFNKKCDKSVKISHFKWCNFAFLAHFVHGHGVFRYLTFGAVSFVFEKASPLHVSRNGCDKYHLLKTLSSVNI